MPNQAGQADLGRELRTAARSPRRRANTRRSTATRELDRCKTEFMKWHRRFLRLAEHIAGWSKDPSTQVGCVVVGPDREIRSTGFNGFPRGIEDSE